MPAPPPALRAAVPLLCTENHGAARTRVRGSGVIADSGGTLLTAAHVILQARSDSRYDCTLSVMVPDEEWTQAGRLRAFLLGDCHLNQPLDLAVCRLRPAENGRDWGYLRAARIRLRPVTAGEPVWVTAFTGRGLFPLTRSGHITGRQNYERRDGCRCDFSTDIAAVEGMSGSPVISSTGEVLGILTLAGNGEFHGLSFGVSFEEAKSFLHAEGVMDSGIVGREKPEPRRLEARTLETRTPQFDPPQTGANRCRDHRQLPGLPAWLMNSGLDPSSVAFSFFARGNYNRQSP